MTEEQKSQLNELLEPLKKAVKDADKDLEIYLEAENDGLWDGIGTVRYEKGEHWVDFERRFELYSQTLTGMYGNSAENLINQIENCINENDYNLFTGHINSNENCDWEMVSTDSYEFSDELQNHSMDDDEIPDEILDDDGEIDVLKLEDDGWEFGVPGGGSSFYNADSTDFLGYGIELNSFTIEKYPPFPDDKIFTFLLD